MSSSFRLLGRSVLAVGALCVALVAWADETLLDEARLLAEQGRYDAALSRVDRFLTDSPRDERGRFLRGVLLVETGRSDEAIVAFKALVEDHPELPEPYNNLAVLYAARGQYSEARDALLSAINTHPSYAIAHENLGDIYAKLAGIAYDQALSLDSNNLAARSKLAMVHELFSTGAPNGEMKPPTQVAAARAATAAVPVAAPAPTTAATPAPAPVAVPAVPAVAAASVVADASPTTGPRQAIVDTVEEWAKAWSAQDVDAYLSHYGRGFRPPGGAARAAWEAERRLRLRKPGSIEVRIQELQVEVSGVDRARVAFVQRYRSDTYADRVRKVLGLAYEDGAWRIVSEVSD